MKNAFEITAIAAAVLLLFWGVFALCNYSEKENVKNITKLIEAGVKQSDAVCAVRPSRCVIVRECGEKFSKDEK